MGEWISVKDKLPEVDKFGQSEPIMFVVVDTTEGDLNKTILTGWYGNGEWLAMDYRYDCGIKINDYDAVTHWMELPNEPEDITFDDALELSAWYINGMPEYETLGVSLQRSSMAELDVDNDGGLFIEDIVNKLPPNVGMGFREIVKELSDEPNNIKRCNKYADGLYNFDSDWERDNCVILKNYSQTVIGELDALSLSWEFENGDCGGSRIFTGLCHISIDDDCWLDVIDVNDYIAISIDGKKIYAKMLAEKGVQDGKEKT